MNNILIDNLFFCVKIRSLKIRSLSSYYRLFFFSFLILVIKFIFFYIKNKWCIEKKKKKRNEDLMTRINFVILAMYNWARERINWLIHARSYIYITLYVYTCITIMYSYIYNLVFYGKTGFRTREKIAPIFK